MTKTEMLMQERDDLQVKIASAREATGPSDRETSDLKMMEQELLALEQRIVEDVSAVEGILRTAKDEGCDLIVVGSHGRSGLSRLMLGSVASKIVAHSTVPVLVTR